MGFGKNKGLASFVLVFSKFVLVNRCVFLSVALFCSVEVLVNCPCYGLSSNTARMVFVGLCFLENDGRRTEPSRLAVNIQRSL